MSVNLANPERRGGSRAAVRGRVENQEQPVAIVAYYKGQRRGFSSSGELEDWLAAERESDRAAPSHHAP